MAKFCGQKDPFTGVAMYEAQLGQKSLSSQAAFLLVNIVNLPS